MRPRHHQPRQHPGQLQARPQQAKAQRRQLRLRRQRRALGRRWRWRGRRWSRGAPLRPVSVHSPLLQKHGAKAGRCQRYLRKDHLAIQNSLGKCRKTVGKTKRNRQGQLVEQHKELPVRRGVCDQGRDLHRGAAPFERSLFCERSPQRSRG